MIMALWRREGRRRWIRVRALDPYFPPSYLCISPNQTPSAEKPQWTVSSTEGPEYGAEAFSEAVEALLLACLRPPGEEKTIWRVFGDEFWPVAAIQSFSPGALWNRGVMLQGVEHPPNRWLLTLWVARPRSTELVAAQVERYLAQWRTLLEALLSACHD